MSTKQVRESSRILASLSASRWVREKRGSWKWQDALRHVEYRAVECRADGRVIWRAATRGPKVPESCGRRHEGSLHHVWVHRRDAIAQLGLVDVQTLEGKGFRFFNVPD